MCRRGEGRKRKEKTKIYTSIKIIKMKKGSEYRTQRMRNNIWEKKKKDAYGIACAVGRWEGQEEDFFQGK